jgi:hypothetical protein
MFTKIELKSTAGETAPKSSEQFTFNTSTQDLGLWNSRFGLCLYGPTSIVCDTIKYRMNHSFYL